MQPRSRSRPPLRLQAQKVHSVWRERRVKLRCEEQLSKRLQQRLVLDQRPGRVAVFRRCQDLSRMLRTLSRRLRPNFPVTVLRKSANRHPSSHDGRCFWTGRIRRQSHRDLRGPRREIHPHLQQSPRSRRAIRLTTQGKTGRRNRLGRNAWKVGQLCQHRQSSDNLLDSLRQESSWKTAGLGKIGVILEIGLYQGGGGRLPTLTIIMERVSKFKTNPCSKRQSHFSSNFGPGVSELRMPQKEKKERQAFVRYNKSISLFRHIIFLYWNSQNSWHIFQHFSKVLFVNLE